MLIATTCIHVRILQALADLLFNTMCLIPSTATCLELLTGDTFPLSQLASERSHAFLLSFLIPMNMKFLSRSFFDVTLSKTWPSSLYKAHTRRFIICLLDSDATNVELV
jgi:hypothetical protein